MSYHVSVLLQEAIEFLKIVPGHKYIDATLGGGGHTREIIKRGGMVLGLDRDQDSIDHVKENFKFEILNLKLKVSKGNFSDINKIAKDAGFEKVSGILFDLGVSSHQIDSPQRGFSYLSSSPLDMRMDQSLGVKASDLVNALGKNELYEIFRKLGDEPRARDISNRITLERKVKPIETTDELARILAQSYGFSNVSDFAKATSGKKVFQALRIAVNDELGSLEDSLPRALEILENKGRLVIITFHSLEDRKVKQAFQMFEELGLGHTVTKKPVLPTEAEMKANSRSKSAKLRVFEKSS